MFSYEINAIIGMLMFASASVMLLYWLGAIFFGLKFQKFKSKKIMRVIFVLFSVLVLFVSIWVGNKVGKTYINYVYNNDYQEVTEVQVNQDVNILVLGDSLAAGMQVNTYYSTYPGPASELAKMLEAQGDLGWYQNWAIPGDTTEDLLNMIAANPTSAEFETILTDNYYSFWDDNVLNQNTEDVAVRQSWIMPNTSLQQLIKDADVIYLSIGGNDILQFDVENYQKNDLRLFAEDLSLNMDDVVSAIQEINPDVEIYINMLYYPFLIYGDGPLVKTGTDVYNIFIKTITEKHSNTYYINPVLQLSNDPALFNNTPDIHPNVDGYELMGQQFINSFAENSKYIDN